jgi:hypothetical protein
MTTMLSGPPEPLQQLGVSLTKRQVTDIDGLAAQVGPHISRSELLRWLVDLAMPIARAQIESRQLATVDTPSS